MSIFEPDAVIHVPAHECPFCDGKMTGGSYYVPGEPTEYYYRCDSCGAGDDGPAFVDDFMDDADHPFDTPRRETAQWVIPANVVKDLREPYKSEAVEGLAEQDVEVEL